MSDLEGQQGLSMGELAGHRKETLLLRDAHKNLTCSEFQCRGSHLKDPGSDPIADIEEPPREVEDNWDSPGGQR